MSWSVVQEKTEWNWVDYMEKELNEADEQCLDLVLQHSDLDRRILKGFEEIREAYSRLDDFSDEFGKSYYENLHSRIMACMEEHWDESDLKWKKKPQSESRLTGLSGA